MNIFSNQEQLRLLCQSLLLGAGVGLAYDVLRAVRWSRACGRAATAALDVLFSLLASAALFEFGLVFAAGQPRLFVLAGAAGGMGAYFASLSAAVLQTLGLLLRAAARACAGCAAALQFLAGGLQRFGIADKIRHCAKIIQIPSSIFREKGIK